MPQPSPLPPMRLLRVFESAARLGSFSAAAEELHTTQSSVSRAIADLERSLGTKLFDRVHRGVRLTREGDIYRDAVAAGFGRIGAAGAALRTMQDSPVVIAASLGVATLFLEPLLRDLRAAVGGPDTGAGIHVLTCDYDMLARVGDDEADIVLSYEEGNGRPEDWGVAFRQAVRPVCAPGYAREHAEALGRPVEEWAGLTILEGDRISRGWATWEDWFEAVGRPRSQPRLLTYFNYTDLLNDAVAGKGLAIGCRRPVARFLESGVLVGVGDGFVEIDRPQYARLTERGRARPAARRCLEFLDETTRRLDRP